jgi:hypothetical protein
VCSLPKLRSAFLRIQRPCLPAVDLLVLTTLCQLFDATVKGYSSSVLLLDRTGTRVRNAVGPGLPTSYMKQLEGGRVSWIEAPFGATINAKTPVIVLGPVL